MNNDDQNIDAKHDPITGTPCAAPQGEGPGAIVAGAAARAAASAGGKPPSRAVAGGSAGQAVAQPIDPTRERAYWKQNFRGRHYVEPGSSFDDYGPAYSFGLSARGRYPGRDFDEIESEMASDWAAGRGASSLNWERARHAVRDAWNRLGPSSGGGA